MEQMDYDDNSSALSVLLTKNYIKAIIVAFIRIGHLSKQTKMLQMCIIIFCSEKAINLCQHLRSHLSPLNTFTKRIT